MHNAEGKRREGAKAKEAEDGFCDRQFKVAREGTKKRDSLIALICGSNDRARRTLRPDSGL